MGLSIVMGNQGIKILLVTLVVLELGNVSRHPIPNLMINYIITYHEMKTLVSVAFDGR